MQVTCQICGKKIEKDTAYQAITIGPRSKKPILKNCCSEQEWLAEEARKKKAEIDKNRVYDLICDMFGYKIINTQFFAEWELWKNLKSNEDIYRYLRENEDYLQQICDRSFDSEYQRIRYFSAVLKNSLRDFKPKAKVEVVEKPKPKVEINETIYEVPTHSLNKRRSLEDLEDMF